MGDVACGCENMMFFTRIGGIKMTELRLAIPTEEYKGQIQEYLNEIDSGGVKDYAGMGGLECFVNNYSDWMKKVTMGCERSLKDNGMPLGTFLLIKFLADQSHKAECVIDYVVGIVDIQMSAGESSQRCGVVSLNVRPSERKSGCGKGGLFLALEVLSALWN